MAYQMDQIKLLFWKKIYTSDNPTLHSLSRLVLGRFAAVGSKYAWNTVYITIS